MRTTCNPISDEAIDWFLRLQDAPGTEPSRHAFSEWLLRSPAHVEEYLRISCSWSMVNVGAEGDLQADALVAAAKHHRESDNVVRLPGRFGEDSPLGGKESGRRLSRRDWTRTLVASLVLTGGLWAAYLGWHPATTFQTVVGEQSSFTLQDGSVVFLNTNSKLRVAWSPTQRHIDLVYGEARFKVAKDPARPFIVATRSAAVRAVGTVFNVRADPLSTQVAVLEGQVEVRVAPAQEAAAGPQDRSKAAATLASAHSSVRLAAGERAAVTSLGIQTNAGPPLESVMAWPERRLVFRDQPLSAVVGEFNRYRTQLLVLDDPGLAGLKISGVFDLSDPGSLIAYLGAYEAVQVELKPDGSQHLFRGPAVIHSGK